MGTPKVDKYLISKKRKTSKPRNALNLLTLLNFTR